MAKLTTEVESMETEATHGRNITRGFALPALLVMCTLTLLTCDGPSAPQLDELSNVYDPESDNYIPMPNIRTASATGILASRAESGGFFATTYGTPVTAKGVCWSTEEEPTLEDDCTNDGQGHDEFTSTIDGLEPDQTYYVRAYAINEAGTVYGDQRSFTTLDGRPFVNTVSVESKGYGTVLCRSEVISEEVFQVEERGVCYVQGSGEPDFSDSCVKSGAGAGSFEVLLEDLELAVRYRIRAYATNAAGTGWGQVLEVATSLHDWPMDIDTEVVEVTNPETGRVWMDRNLGAGRAATSPTDELAYGDLYQWGRPTDGHQKRNSSTTSTRSIYDQPGHGNFIITPEEPNDWRSLPNNDLWQGIDGINNPCPLGYRLPTDAEWEAERSSWISDDAAGAFASSLKLPQPGNRIPYTGLMSYGLSLYWSGSGGGSSLYFLSSGNLGITVYQQARGGSVRCIKD